MSEPNVHTFLPGISMREREDGRYDVHFEFGDSYNGSYITESNEFVDDDGAGPRTEAGIAACEALDAWRKTIVTDFIIDPA